MGTREEFVRFAERIAAGPYYYWTGARRCDPIHSGYADCSGLVVAALHSQGVNIECTGSFMLARYCHWNDAGISISEARHTRGALLFIGMNEGQGGIPGVDPGHIAISRGDGTTVEARNRRAGITIGPFDGRGWDYAAVPYWIPPTVPTIPKPPELPKEHETMLIYAPKRQQTQGSSQPAYVHLDVNERLIVGHNGAKLKERGGTPAAGKDSFQIKLNASPVGWCTVDGETILVALKGSSDKPLHFHFA